MKLNEFDGLMAKRKKTLAQIKQLALACLQQFHEFRKLRSKVWTMIPDKSWVSGLPSTADLISPFEGSMEGMNHNEWVRMIASNQRIEENVLPCKYKPLSIQHGEKKADESVKQAAKEHAAAKAADNNMDDDSQIVNPNIIPSGNPHHKWRYRANTTQRGSDP